MPDSQSTRNLCPQPATFLEKRLWHRCFAVNTAKFLRTHFLQNRSGRLPLETFKDWFRSYLKVRKGVLKICSKLTGKHQCWSAISIKLQSNSNSNSKVTLLKSHFCMSVLLKLTVINTAQKTQFLQDLVIFTEEILNTKLRFLCSESCKATLLKSHFGTGVLLCCMFSEQLWTAASGMVFIQP